MLPDESFQSPTANTRHNSNPQVPQSRMPHVVAPMVAGPLDNDAQYLRVTNTPAEQDHGSQAQRRRNLAKEMLVRLVHRYRPPKVNLREILKRKEDFFRTVEVNRKFQNGDYRDRVPAHVLFDTGSTDNFVSQRWLNMHNIQYRFQEEERLVHLRARDIRVVGVITLEWFGRPESYRKQVVHLKHTTIECEFLVLSDLKFDLIVGSETLLEENLLSKPRWCFAEDSKRTQGGNSCAYPQTDGRKTKEAQERQATNKDLAKAARQRSSNKHRIYPLKKRP